MTFEFLWLFTSALRVILVPKCWRCFHNILLPSSVFTMVSSLHVRAFGDQNNRNTTQESSGEIEKSCLTNENCKHVAYT